MSRLILLIALLATSADAGSCARRFTGDDACRIYDTHCFAVACYREAPRVRLAANYDRQNEAIKQCMAATDPDNHATAYFDCMEKKGMHFCPNCPSFGVLMGEYCWADLHGVDRPACWYVMGQKPETATQIMERWKHWIKDRGWEKQSAPYGPPDMEWDNKMVKEPPVPRDEWDPRQFIESPQSKPYELQDGWHRPRTPEEMRRHEEFCLRDDPTEPEPYPGYCHE